MGNVERVVEGEVLSPGPRQVGEGTCVSVANVDDVRCCTQRCLGLGRRDVSCPYPPSQHVGQLGVDQMWQPVPHKTSRGDFAADVFAINA